jgi:type II secretory ATPase GspE/PulE/Tfp pilus assembly ATPase PilB-like protein
VSMAMNMQEHEFPVVKIVDNLLEHAITHAASDIHFEPMAQQLRVRLRVDGVLYDHEPVDGQVMQQLLARLKVLADINIAEKRKPQDGKFRIISNGNEVDLRVSTFPTLHGEKIVVRILDRADHTMVLDRLGFDEATSDHIKELIGKASGFFLVAGPTGSGKTTTLYGALSALNSPEKNIITLEDPVEYFIPGITQGQIHPDAGFTFEKGIRALLRQDPDIVMVGEIRDKETARTAIEAALTGHLVFSTVHANDAASVIMRLMDMGIEPFLINAAVTGVLAQRLARKICVSCKMQHEATPQELAVLKKYGSSLTSLFAGAGCTDCGGLGYKGRVGIFELLIMSSGLRSLIVQHPSFDQIKAKACADGMQLLVNNGLAKVQQGIISLSELMRVVT